MVRKLTYLLMVVVAASLPLAAQESEKKSRMVLLGEDGIFLDGEPLISMPFLGRHYIGVSTTRLTPELREHFGSSKEAGLMISKVMEKSPAEKAGLRVGDLIVSIDGKSIDSSADIARALKDKDKNSTVRVEVLRNRARQSFNVGLEERSEMKAFSVAFPEGGFHFEPFGENDESRRRVLREVHRSVRTPEAQARWMQLQDCNEVQERLKDVEARLKDLEKKLKQ